MINPDGVARGHYRCDTKGKDLNRVYNAIDPKEHPGPYSVMEVSKYLAEKKRLVAYIDFHAHSNKDGGFLFGIHPENKK